MVGGHSTGQQRLPSFLTHPIARPGPGVWGPNHARPARQFGKCHCRPRFSLALMARSALAVEDTATDLEFRMDNLQQLAHTAPVCSAARLASMRLDRWLAQNVAAIVRVPSGTVSDHTEWDLTLRAVMTTQCPRTAPLVEVVMTQAQRLTSHNPQTARAAKPPVVNALALLYMHLQCGMPPPGWEAARSRIQHLRTRAIASESRGHLRKGFFFRCF